MHRLFSPESIEPRPAVMLQHGILASSETFVLNGKESAAFKFASAGYDVWLGNSRGTLYSRSHEYLNPDDPEDSQAFFDFSFAEMAQYDVPAQINMIKETTGHDKISYVGHS